ncbi:SGNH/GDSL hydrolase family protein [[Flexibacter] sp. ATCC 35208]|uniref:SGNH/GDSL hydrolase family protein n=1 Tax=[Flexibacter] sp. ATCC 35208 TaxID=1936242 RepID=UPI0009CDF798|nr:SGNH/GDSL hydrolase family protein [[Flexibacter] sp. ATCC 35208]OMP74553.1 hypothetical protein BW716_34740 [[Flexibacter] sp. ATCC 35208]
MRNYIFGLSIVFWFSCTKSTEAVNNPGESAGSKSANIVIIGSSSAAGIGANPTDSGWVNRLRLATLDNKKTLYFINLAVAGYTTYQGVPENYSVQEGMPLTDTTKNITKALSYYPSLVMITYPTNDVANGYSDNEIMSNYKEMVRLLDSAKVKYILFGTQPRNFDDAAIRSRLKTLNEKMMSNYGDKFNNLYDTLSTPEGYIKPEFAAADGIHLNNRGHYLIVQSVLSNSIFKTTIQ